MNLDDTHTTSKQEDFLWKRWPAIVSSPRVGIMTMTMTIFYSQRSICSLVLTLLLLSQRTEGVEARTTCRDDPYYRYNLNRRHDCEWIKNHQVNLCEEDDDIGTISCPVSCGQCDDGQHDLSVDSISTNSNCYEYGEEIVTTYTSSKPQVDDWIGLYRLPIWQSSENLIQTPYWVWNCDATQDEETFCKVQYGSVSFGSDPNHQSGTDYWPADPGRYKAFLARRNSETGQYFTLVESDSFEVLPYGETCPDTRKSIPASTTSSTNLHHTTGVETNQYSRTLDADCINIYLDGSCYVEGDILQIVLQNCEPLPDTYWVGIYDHDANSQHLMDEPLLWFWASIVNIICSPSRRKGTRTRRRTNFFLQVQITTFGSRRVQGRCGG